jgi:hypothetical protein
MNDNVGTPFVKDFNSLYVDKILRATRFQEELQVFLNTGKNTRFWGNYRLENFKLAIHSFLEIVITSRFQFG